jgi:transposase
MSARVKRLEEAILEVVKLAPQPMQEVVRGLQALRGVAHISAVTIAAELGNITSRFESARKLMGYGGVIPSEDSSGKRKRQGGITKSGNAHLRRIVVESAWSIDTGLASGPSCVSDSKGFGKKSLKSHGRHRIACTSVT